MDVPNAQSEELADSPRGMASLGLWRQLISDQTDLFSNTVQQNETLVHRNRELEREVTVWKQALTKADSDQENVQQTADTLRQQVKELQQQVRSLHEDSPIILVLVDGDGNIFSEELLRQGTSGGRIAASLLTKGITDHTTIIKPQIASRARLWVSIYCNKQGLSETLRNNNICSAEDFESFCVGFNQAAPLFSIIDVGQGKEAADAKIKEYLRVFSPLPQMSLVYFGGGHDNGYSSALASLQTDGLLDKVILLHGYEKLAFELQHLKLQTLQIDGLFRPNKVPSYLPRAKNVKRPTESRQNTAEDSSDSSVGIVVRKRKLKPNLPIAKQTPPPCNFHYLSSCDKGPRCSYAHDYELTAAQFEEVRRSAKKFPCIYLNRAKPCPMGDTCFSSHQCPHGKTCAFMKAGKCRFTGKDMHSKNTKGSHEHHKSSKSSISSSQGPSASDSPPADELENLNALISAEI